MKKYTYIAVAVLILTACLSSCGTHKNLRGGVDSPEVLSRRLGVRVTSKDNLHLYTFASRWLGTPYRPGGSSMRGVDCSGFAGTLYREVYKEPFSGSSADILKYNCKKVKRSSLREGDLVFFRTSGNKKKIPNHMGVYLKNGRFVHASSSKGVTISSLSEPYYLRTWLTGGRVK